MNEEFALSLDVKNYCNEFERSWKKMKSIYIHNNINFMYKGKIFGTVRKLHNSIPFF